MRVYMFQAALYCQACGEALREKIALPAGADPDDDYSFDSDDYPKGPFDNGGGEADYACHCDACGVHLENQLTPDGEDHVRDAVESGEGAADVLATWRDFYAYLFQGRAS